MINRREGEFFWAQITKETVWTSAVVVQPASRDLDASFVKRIEGMLVEALVTELAVE